MKSKTPPAQHSRLAAAWASDMDESTPTQIGASELSCPDENVPDGGYGWAVVFACFVHIFWMNAWTGSWGVLQIALLQSTLRDSTSSVVSFVGSLGIALSIALGIPTVRVAQRIGARYTSLVGILLSGIGITIAGSAVTSVGGLFATCGVLYGIGSCLMFTMSNSLPVQWFDKRLGTANGLIKLGGGIGATVMVVLSGVLIEKVGVSWTLRTIGVASLVTGVPAAFLIRERQPSGAGFSLDLSLFKDVPFRCVLAAGAVGVFSVYIPPFFLPLIATSLGFSSTTAAAITACFNAFMAIGRLGSGIACDKLGALKMLLLTLLLNAFTTLALWTFSSTLAPLLIFAILNGLANGSFFVTLPTAVARLVGEKQAVGGISIALTGWTAGFLMGGPIAGFLIDATNADQQHSIVPYRPAIFYAGGTALLSAALVGLGWLRIGKSLPTGL